MRRRVTVRPAADRDLDDQAEYLAVHRDVEIGVRFYRAAEETFQLLASQSEMGRRTEYRSPLLVGMRMFPMKGFPKYLVFYRPVEGGVEIIRVLHGARDIESLFNPETG